MVPLHHPARDRHSARSPGKPRPSVLAVRILTHPIGEGGRPLNPDRREVVLFVLEAGRYAVGERTAAGRIPSRALPGLELTIEDLFAI